MLVDIGSVNDPCTLSWAITFIEGVQDIELIGELDRDAGLMQQIINMFTTSLLELKIKQTSNIIVCHRLPVCSKHFSVVPKLLWMSSVLYLNQLTFLQRLHVKCSDGELTSLTASISTITPYQLRTLHVWICIKALVEDNYEWHANTLQHLAKVILSRTDHPSFKWLDIQIGYRMMRLHMDKVVVWKFICKQFSKLWDLHTLNYSSVNWKGF